MKTKSFDEYLKSRFSKEKIQELEKQADIEFIALKSLQEDLAKTITAYMTQEKIGFNELVKRLGSSPSQVKKIQTGEGNITLATIAHIAGLLNKKPKLVFESGR